MPPHGSRPRSGLVRSVDGQNLDLRLSVRSLEKHLIACAVSEHCGADRAEVGYSAEQRICLVRADDVVFDILIEGEVVNLNDRAEVDNILLNFGFAYDLRIAYQLFELGDAGNDLCLLVFRFIVFAVLGKITVAAGNLDFFGYIGSSLRFKVFKLFFKLF